MLLIMAIEIEEATPFENILHYGLMVGAVFQLICIFAVIFIPKSDIEQDSEEEVREPPTSARVAPSSHHSNKKNTKRERKKNR